MSLNNFLKQLGTGDDIHDFQHASKTFVDGGMQLHPKHSFSYHVFFEPTSGVSTRAQTSLIEAGMMVKEVNLPTFQMDVKKYNSYNRTNLVQSKINYQPVTFSFYDDMADNVRDLWRDYYSYYYQDPRLTDTVYPAEYKYSPLAPKAFGYSGGPQGKPYFNTIRIYQLHQKRYSEYRLINPIITEWQHGRQASSSSDPVDCSMTVQFETVLYATGYVSNNTVNGFGDLHYDKSPSPLTPAGGGTNSIVGPGGLLDTISSVNSDLASGNILGAAFSTLRAANNFKGSNFKQIAASEFKTGLNDILAGKNPAQRFYTPTPSANATKPPTARQYGENQ